MSQPINRVSLQHIEIFIIVLLCFVGGMAFHSAADGRCHETTIELGYSEEAYQAPNEAWLLITDRGAFCVDSKVKPPIDNLARFYSNFGGACGESRVCTEGACFTQKQITDCAGSKS